MGYGEAFELLVKKSKWTRREVLADPTSAAWFVAARETDRDAAEEAQYAGQVVARGPALPDSDTP